MIRRRSRSRPPRAITARAAPPTTARAPGRRHDPRHRLRHRRLGSGVGRGQRPAGRRRLLDGSGSTFSHSCPNYVAATRPPAGRSPSHRATSRTAAPSRSRPRRRRCLGNTTATSAPTVNIDYDPAHTLFVATSGNDTTGTGSIATRTRRSVRRSRRRPRTLDVIAVGGGGYPGTVSVDTGIAGAIIRGGYGPSSWVRSAPDGNTVTITGDTTAGSANANSRVGVYIAPGFNAQPRAAQHQLRLAVRFRATAGSAYGILNDGGSGRRYDLDQELVIAGSLPGQPVPPAPAAAARRRPAAREQTGSHRPVRARPATTAAAPPQAARAAPGAPRQRLLAPPAATAETAAATSPGPPVRVERAEWPAVEGRR